MKRKDTPLVWMWLFIIGTEANNCAWNWQPAQPEPKPPMHKGYRPFWPDTYVTVV